MHRFLFDSSGVLRPAVLAGLFAVVLVAVLALASWGGWAGLTMFSAIFAAGLGLMIRSDR
ncbi:hypothetical protein SAMN05660733_05395 [Lentzea albidocapillata]|uniref:Uncharacterized protein n=1 Tax=Lentzea albidocapillata TaxID=40571 RepID=A0A1W2F915_9PSEU|nr:hypothetical protein SAMN05660733_05395 [Lentzea albidocapillata]